MNNHNEAAVASQTINSSPFAADSLSDSFKFQITWEKKGQFVFKYFVTCGMIDSVKKPKQNKTKKFQTRNNSSNNNNNKTRGSGNETKQPTNQFISKTDEFSDGH